MLEYAKKIIIQFLNNYSLIFSNNRLYYSKKDAKLSCLL